MHLWRIVNGRPSWLDAVWVSGIVILISRTWDWCNAILDYLEPKGTAYLMLGYVIFLIIFFGFLGGYMAVFFYNQNQLASVFRYPRIVWLFFASVACGLLTQLIYEYADVLWPMVSDSGATHWPIDIQASSKAIGAYVQHRMDISLAISIAFLSLCYALVVACVERFPNFANRVAYYVAIVLTVIGSGAKLALAFRH